MLAMKASALHLNPQEKGGNWWLNQFGGDLGKGRLSISKSASCASAVGRIVPRPPLFVFTSIPVLIPLPTTVRFLPTRFLGRVGGVPFSKERSGVAHCWIFG